MERWSIAESYSDPFSIYNKAMEAGMSMATITDHNSMEGCLILKERYGDCVVTGVESTAYFPEDGCKVHVLIYGLDEKEFAEIQACRRDIYDLRDYLRERSLAHSVAHATYSVQPGMLTVAHIEKLICLFNVFEVINGGRNRADNAAWRHILENLTPGHLETLCRKHGLEPFDSQPWAKGFTAGSDDHGGIFIGKTYTEAPRTADLLDSLRGRKTNGKGRDSDYQTLVFSVYKVMYDASRKDKASSSLVSQLAEALFEGKRMGFTNRLRMSRLKARGASKKGKESDASPLQALLGGLEKQGSMTMEERIRLVYSTVSDFSDSFLRLLFKALGPDLAKLDLFAMAKNCQASLPGLFLALPFLLTLRHLNGNRSLAERLAASLQIGKAEPCSRVLWFTDTLYDLNGVSVTLQEVGRIALERGLDVRIVTAADPAKAESLPPNVLNLPCIHEFDLPYYESYRLKVPSMLASLKELYRFEPDAIHISTPGPVGLFGLMVAKLMNIRSIGFYHTDFARQVREIVEDESVPRMVEAYSRWFYSAMDEVRVPTDRYATMLKERGFDPRKIRRFSRGIDLAAFNPAASPGRSSLASRFGLGPGPVLLYVGRISRDKGLDFLLETYEEIAQSRKEVNLLIVGDGPYLSALKDRKGLKRVTFTGTIGHDHLPALYAASDLFVFPSTTDTFGRVVLEAQACGLPAIVSDEGGPQEIIMHGRTGFVARAESITDWVQKVDQVLAMMEETPSLYRAMRAQARERAIERFDWADLEDPLVDGPVTPEGAEKKIA